MGDIGDTIESAWDTVTDPIEEGWDEVSDAASDAWDEIKEEKLWAGPLAPVVKELDNMMSPDIPTPSKPPRQAPDVKNTSSESAKPPRVADGSGSGPGQRTISRGGTGQAVGSPLNVPR